MAKRGNNILEVMFAADGQIVGKIRTQKIFYLLDQLGMNGGYEFSYHHYGPYSANLASQLDANVMFGDDLDECVQETKSGNAFSTFKLKSNNLEFLSVGDLTVQNARELIQQMKNVSSVVIELAATIHWLSAYEKIADWREELKVRKPQKATDERIEKALNLLGTLGLEI